MSGFKLSNNYVPPFCIRITNIGGLYATSQNGGGMKQKCG